MKNIMSTIADICTFSPRQGEGEERTADYLIGCLCSEDRALIIQQYETIVPIVRDAHLQINDTIFHSPHVEGSCRVSGKIGGKIAFEDPTQPSYDLESVFTSVIAHNPHCEAASQATFYDLPAVAVTREVFEMAIQAHWNYGHVDGYVAVERKKHLGRNIIVGNSKTPEILCMTHYDCLKKGALDNASGVAVLLAGISRMRIDLERVLIAFCGTEEISCENGYYGGRGYHALQAENRDAFDHAKKIIVVDSVGNQEPRVLKGSEDSTCYSALPVPFFEEVKEKLHLIFGEMKGLMHVYHSDDDDGHTLREEYLEQTVDIVCNQLMP